jgi:polar amino acid transport system substrate-binding protein
MKRSLTTLLLALALLAGACGDSTGTSSDSESPAEPAATSEAAPPSETEAADACAPESMPTVKPGTLTVATGEPAFPPWVEGDDDPTSKKGFEAAVVYAVAEELGFDDADVKWTRTGFDAAIAPGDKPYDFNIQQYGITPKRDKVVDFSDGYYTVQQALVAAKDSQVAKASSIDDLKSLRLGAAIGTTSLDYIEEVIQPEQQAQVYDDNAAAKAAFNAGQVDGIVFDLPTAYYITAVEIPKASIVGVLPLAGTEPEQLGMLFTDGSELVPCVNEALSALKEDGTLERLEQRWLRQGGDIPTLSE